MEKKKRLLCGALALTAICGLVGCNRGDGAIKLTVWVSEADRPFATQVANDFKAKNPDKKYNIVIDIQGENDVATRVLNDVENSADVYAFINDQISKLINGDALAQIAGERLQRVQSANSKDSMASATATVNGVEGVYGMPFTDNTFFLYYNKSVLNDEDVKSIDGILSKCTGGKQFAYPMKDGWYSSAFFFGKDLGFSVEYGKDLAETQITCNFDNATGQEVTKAMWELVRDSRVKADADDSKITAGFNDGSIIAGVTGIWNRNAIEKSLGANFSASKLPTYTYKKGTAEEEQVQLVSFSGYKLMGVNNYSKHKTDAMDFAEFYTNRQNQIKHFEARGYVPTDETARQDEKVQADVCAKAITQQLNYSKTQKDVPSTLWIPMEGLGTAMLTAKQSGNFDLAGQLKACVDAIKKTTK